MHRRQRRSANGEALRALLPSGDHILLPCGLRFALSHCLCQGLRLPGVDLCCHAGPVAKHAVSHCLEDRRLIHTWEWMSPPSLSSQGHSIL
jgi:hypothetical protein